MKTQKTSIDMVAWIAELIELHMEQCDDKYPADAIPHIFDDEDVHTGVNVDRIENVGNTLLLNLSDGSSFKIEFTQVAP